MKQFSWTRLKRTSLFSMLVSSLLSANGIHVEINAPQPSGRLPGATLFGTGLISQPEVKRFHVRLDNEIAKEQRPAEWQKLSDRLKNTPAFTCESNPSHPLMDRLANTHMDYVPRLAAQLRGDAGALESYEATLGIQARKAEEAAHHQGDLKALDDVIYQYPYTKASVSAAYFLAFHFQRNGQYHLSALYAQKAIELSEVAGIWDFQPELAIRQGINAKALKNEGLFNAAYQSFQIAKQRGNLNADRLLFTLPNQTPVAITSLESFTKASSAIQPRPVEPFDIGSLFLEPLPPSAEWVWRGVRLLGEGGFKLLSKNGTHHFKIACAALEVERLPAQMEEMDRKERDGYLAELLGPELGNELPSPLITRAFFDYMKHAALPFSEVHFHIGATLDPKGNHFLPLVEKQIASANRRTDSATLTQAFNVVGQYGPRAGRSVDTILQYIYADDAGNFDTRAIEALGKIGKKPEESIPLLLRALKEHLDVRDQAAMALTHFSPTSTEILLKELTTPTQLTPIQAAYALGFQREAAKSAIPELTKQLKEAKPSEKAHFARALGFIDIHAPGIDSILIDALRNPKTPDGLFSDLEDLIDMRNIIQRIPLAPLIKEFESTPIMKRGNLSRLLATIGPRDPKVATALATTVTQMVEDSQESQDLEEVAQAIQRCAVNAPLMLQILIDARINTPSKSASEKLKVIMGNLKWAHDALKPITPVEK